MSFNTFNLAGNRTLVKGTDGLGTVGETILDSSQWNALKADEKVDTRIEEFDAAVAAFFEPITKAADKLEAELSSQEFDEAFIITRGEDVDAVEGKGKEYIELTHDSAVLRLIEEDPNAPRLVWHKDNLEILERVSTTPVFDAVSDATV